MAAGCVVSGALVRITVDALGVATEFKTLIKDEWCQQFPSHSVGTVGFGPDGMLYASAGEGASFSQRDWGQLPGTGGYPSNPCGDPVDEGGAMRAQDVRTTGDPTGLSGAIIRVDPDTGAGAPGILSRPVTPARAALIAYGLRNPFRWAFRPGTSEIWLGDVGSQEWEELDVVPDASDSVAENFGWPCFEGAEPPGGLGQRAEVPDAVVVRDDACPVAIPARPRGRARRRLPLEPGQLDLRHRVPVGLRR